MQLLRTKRRSLVGGLFVCTLAALAVSVGATSALSQAGGVDDITVVSNRADLISGGDALVSVDLSANPRSIRVELNGANITSAFAVRPNGRYEGLVTGLREGTNILRVRPGNGVGRWIEITNHPIGGPVFTGRADPAVAVPDSACRRAPLRRSARRSTTSATRRRSSSSSIATSRPPRSGLRTTRAIRRRQT